jgi:hypothetical protein
MTKDQEILVSALEKHDYDEWYSAILHTAMEETKNAARAVEVADKIFADNPKDTSKPEKDDADALFAKPKG